MAVIKRGKSKYWYSQFMYNSRTYIKSTKTTNKKLAEQIDREHRNSVIERETLGGATEITIGDALDNYQKSKSDLSSIRTIKANIDFVKKNTNCKRSLSELTLRDVELLVQKRKNDGKSSATCKHMVNFIRGAIKLAKRQGHSVPVLELPVIKPAKHRLRYLTLDEEAILLRELNPRREGSGIQKWEDRSDEMRRMQQDNYDLVVVLLDTGARLGEIETLKWRDIDLEANTIHLYRHKVKNESVIHLTNRAAEIMRRRQENRNHSVWVFTNREGTNHRHQSRQAIVKAIERAGLDDVNIHTLRHTAASRLIQNGLTLYEVSQILGHSSVTTTARYAHLEKADVSRKAADVLNSIQSAALKPALRVVK